MSIQNANHPGAPAETIRSFPIVVVSETRLDALDYRVVDKSAL
jgi:hypothetical protein